MFPAFPEPQIGVDSRLNGCMTREETPSFRITPLTEADAHQVLGWHWDGICTFSDENADEEDGGQFPNPPNGSPSGFLGRSGDGCKPAVSSCSVRTPIPTAQRLHVVLTIGALPSGSAGL